MDPLGTLIAALAGLVAGAPLPALAHRLLADRREPGEDPPPSVSAAERAGAPLATAVAFGLIAAAEPRAAELAGLLPFATVCVLVSLTDLRERLIPNRVTLPAAIYGVLAAVVFRDAAPAGLLASGAIAFAVLFGLVLVNPRGLGMGDAKLGGLIGLYLGPPVAPALFIGIALGVVYGVGVAIRFGVARARRTTLPFGPLLSLGALAGVLVGPPIIDAYLDSVAAGLLLG